MQVLRFDELDSTQLEARRRAQSGSITGPTLIYALRQRSGIGRLARPWASPAGGLWMTLAVPDAPELPAWIGLAFGEALLGCCRDALPATIRPAAALKWPNDVMIGDQKVAGILTERLKATPPQRGAILLVGVGVNANIETAALPLDLHERSTSLAVYRTEPVDLGTLAECIAGMLLERIAHPPDGAALALRLGKSLWGRGRTVPITLPDGRRVEGEIEGLSTDGSLIATIDGEHREVRSVEAIG